MLLKWELVGWGERRKPQNTWIIYNAKTQLPRAFQGMLYVMLTGLTNIDTYEILWSACPRHQAITKSLMGLRSLLCSTHILSPLWPFKDFSSHYKILVLESQIFSSSSAYSTEGQRYREMLGYVSWISQTLSKHLLAIFTCPSLRYVLYWIPKCKITSKVRKTRSEHVKQSKTNTKAYIQ